MSTADLPGPDQHYADALASVRHAIDQFAGCSAEEKQALRKELGDLEAMVQKLESGRVEIVLFGEIDTGKSALINALVGQRGGPSRRARRLDPGRLAHPLGRLRLLHRRARPVASRVDRHAGHQRGRRRAAGRDGARCGRPSRPDPVRHRLGSESARICRACRSWPESHKPILLVFNKTDNYTAEQRQILCDTFAQRLRGIVAADDMIETSADPLPREYVIEAADGSTRSEFRRPAPQIEALKERILEVLARDGKALVALNGAMYAADRSDRITAMKLRMRDEQATAIIWSYAAMKSIAVALTPMPVVDVLGGSAVDATMVVTLAHVYGVPLTWNNARALIESILKAAGWVMLGEAATNVCLHAVQQPDARFGKISHGLAAGGRRGLRIGHRRAGGQILFRAWRLVGRRSAQDRGHTHLAGHRQAIGAGAPEIRNPPQDQHQSARRQIRPAVRRGPSPTVATSRRAEEALERQGVELPIREPLGTGSFCGAGGAKCACPLLPTVLG